MKFLFRLLVGLFKHKIKIETDGNITVFIIARCAMVDLELLEHNLSKNYIPSFIIQTSDVEGIKIIKI